MEKSPDRLAFPVGALADVVARVGDPDYGAFVSAVERAGHCVRPVRLRGGAQAVDVGSGEVLAEYSTTGGPDGVLLVACGDRRAAVCPPCAAVYRADTWHLVVAGMRGSELAGDGPRSGASAGMPATVSDHPAVFATLTAPSFGKVHTIRQDGTCRPRKQRPVCEHGTALWCNARHEADDVRAGTALCAECYDYVGHILWHTAVPDLWRRFTIALPRAVARLRWVRDKVRLKVADIGKELRVSYFKVIEWQRRAALHVHVVLRLDGIDPDDTESVVPPPGWADAGLLDQAVREAAEAVWIDLPLSTPDQERIARWGSQVDVQQITEPAKIAGYLAKYATKTASDTVPGLPVRRFSHLDLDRMRGRGVSEHVLMLAGTCLALAEDPACAELRLADWVHTLGFAGHFASKSRRYSSTRKNLKAVRREWRADQRGGEDVWGQDGAAVVGDWRLVGIGYKNPGDVLLAEQLARDEAAYKDAIKNHEVIRVVPIDWEQIETPEAGEF